MKEKIFFLGGHDLEMLEIKKMLEENRVQFFDKELSWYNAGIEAYQEELKRYGRQQDTCIFGIELHPSVRVVLPENYVLIDHHNQFSGRPASIVQVARLLHADLTRYRRLVAANDSGYIPAMLALGATPEEIETIRRNDRAEQGVTGEDERLAEKAIDEKSIQNHILVIKAYSPRFSPICDRLYPYKKLLIYTDDELMYYGEGKELLAGKFAEEVKVGKMFHGGGGEGFIGTARAVYSQEEIKNIKNDIICKFLNL